MIELSGDVVSNSPKQSVGGNEIINLTDGQISLFDVRDVHTNAILSNFALAYEQSSMFIADKILKNFKVKKESDSWYKFYQKDILSIPENIERGDTAETAIVTADLTSDSYTCIEYALGMLVPQRSIDNADDPLKPERDATNILTELILANRERRAATALFNTTTFSGYTAALSAGTQWDDPVNSVPRTNMKKAKNSVRQYANKRPNVLVVGETVWDYMENHPNLLSYISPGGKPENPGLLSKRAVAQIMQVDELHVGGAVYNTANKGQTASISDIWGDYALFAYVDPQVPLRGMTLGMNIQSQALIVAKYWVPSRRSWMIEVSVIEVQKIVAAMAGYLFSDVLS